MNLAFSLFAVALLILVPIAGAGWGNFRFLFGIVLPYAALAVFLAGFVYRVIRWAMAPVPFRIPTTCGQQKSLPWIKAARFENPHSTAGVIGRIATEVLLFRSLFRNTKASLREGTLVYGSAKWLWLGGLLFHWAFLVIVLRHLRFFLQPVPACVGFLTAADGFFQIGVPALYLTDAAVLAGLTYLFFRRIAAPQVRYISLAADYFPLLLISGVAVSGILLRHVYKVDLIAVKDWALALAAFQPFVPQGIGIPFFIHLFLVSVLIAYFPMSKLMHMAGVFLSPTRNLVNDSRRRRHVNPWNAPVAVHTYAEYEEEFRDRMKAAGLPVEKE